MEDSIFTKIIKGEISAHKIYEDDKTFAFLDINPKQPGHSLVIPKNQVAYLWDLPDEDYHALMEAVKKVGRRIKEVLNPNFVGLQVEGVEIAHAHVHVFPFNTPEEFYIRAVPGAKAPDKELAEMAEKLRF